MLTDSPFTLDEVELSLARLGDPIAKRRVALALQSGIAYAARAAVAAGGDGAVRVEKVVLQVRRHLDLPDAASFADSPLSVPLINNLLKSGRHGESHVRGLLRETARAVVSDLSHRREPRRGLLKRLFTSLFTTR